MSSFKACSPRLRRFAPIEFAFLPVYQENTILLLRIIIQTVQILIFFTFVVMRRLAAPRFCSDCVVPEYFMHDWSCSVED
jgi:hypothetical protein